MQHTRNDWYVACAVDDIADDKPIAIQILDEQIAIWRAGDGLVALEDRCIHRAAPLSLGRCEGVNLRCMYHGILFDDAGEAIEIPGQDVIPPTAKVRTYPVTTRYGLVWVWMGDPAIADAGLVPSLFPGVDFDDYVTGTGAMDFEAEAQLISDNLLDFSHTPYVHASTFQSPPEWAQTTMTVKPLDRGVRFERWLENGTSGAFLFGDDSAPLIDEWVCYDYLVPGVLIMWIAVFPKGTARGIDFARPDFSEAVGQVIAQLQTVTPVSERLSRYHFVVGMHRKLGDPSLIDKMVEVVTQAFLEDKRMIEAQQRVIDRDPERPVMPIAHDRGVTLYRRLKAGLIARESTARDEDRARESALACRADDA